MQGMGTELVWEGNVPPARQGRGMIVAKLKEGDIRDSTGRKKIRAVPQIQVHLLRKHVCENGGRDDEVERSRSQVLEKGGSRISPPWVVGRIRYIDVPEFESRISRGDVLATPSHACLIDIKTKIFDAPILNSLIGCKRESQAATAAADI